MDIEQIRKFCLSHKEATESFPFDKDVLAFKVFDKIFALISLSKWERGERSLNLKCDPDIAVELREEYPETVLPGYHMNKKHWNTLVLHTGEFSERKVKHFILHSYELVVSKLPKSKRELLKQI
jgi:predicted DNA-binding protein (MmcQ/YjbR family)